MQNQCVTGLRSSEVAALLEKFGPNIIVEKRRVLPMVQFLRQFTDLLVIILIVASGIAYIAGERIDAIIILFVVVLNAGIGFLQEFKAEKAIEALKKMLAPRARVVRDGKELLIPAQELVPGDLMILNEGDKISADAELIDENEIRADESILTGESVPVAKDTAENKKLFMGTQITHGTGRAVVTKTGMQTEFGKIATLTSQTKKDKSPLQKELAGIGAFVGKITLGISLLLFLIGTVFQGRGIVETLLFAVSVAVAAVPEGLPATITVALAIGVQRLARENAIVKQLSSVETLGSTTVICSDKTGTLTKNEMTVQEVILDDAELMVRGVGYAPEGSFAVHAHEGHQNYFEFQKKDLLDLAKKQPIFSDHLELLCRAAALCNNAKLINDDGWHILGDPTEGALITLAEKAGFSLENFSEKHEKIHEVPFDSGRKRMSVIFREKETSKRFAYVKGAPDALLSLCTHMLKNGKLMPFGEAEKAEYTKRADLMANRALRTIAFAYREVAEPKLGKYTADEVEQNLIFLGVVGMIDPPREEVKEAVKLTHKAGIRVFIITGDHGLTAHAIAKELGLVSSYGVHIVTGELLNKISDEKLKQFVAKGQETIFARVSPEHKLRIVEALKQLGETVAVTGDGVNDAPALKRADIGVAMGITGTDVSKEAANMVLADDSFRTIVTAVIEGRTIYENMKKFIFFIFSANIGELVAVFATLLMGLPAPLTAVLILIVNVLTDVFPSLALSVEPVERNILEKAPRKPTDRIMEWPFIRRFLINGVWIGFLTVGVFLWNLRGSGWHFGEAIDTESFSYAESVTMAFVILTISQMVHALSSRSDTLSIFRMKFFSNLSLLAAIAFSTIGTVLLVQMPFFQKYLGTVGLSGTQWAVLFGCSFLAPVVEEVRKLSRRFS